MLQTYCSLSIIEKQTKKLSVNWQSLETYGVTNYGSGWRKDVVNLCLEFGHCRPCRLVWGLCFSTSLCVFIQQKENPAVVKNLNVHQELIFKNVITISFAYAFAPALCICYIPTSVICLLYVYCLIRSIVLTPLQMGLWPYWIKFPYSIFLCVSCVCLCVLLLPVRCVPSLTSWS